MTLPAHDYTTLHHEDETKVSARILRHFYFTHRTRLVFTTLSVSPLIHRMLAQTLKHARTHTRTHTHTHKHNHPCTPCTLAYSHALIHTVEQYVPPGPPLLPRLPWDVFYPFVVSAAVGRVESVIVFEIVCVAFVFLFMQT